MTLIQSIVVGETLNIYGRYLSLIRDCSVHMLINSMPQASTRNASSPVCSTFSRSMTCSDVCIVSCRNHRQEIANMEYVNGVLERVNFEGGYIDMTGESPRYMYYVTVFANKTKGVPPFRAHSRIRFWIKLNLVITLQHGRC